MKKLLFLIAGGIFLYSCGNQNTPKDSGTAARTEENEEKTENHEEKTENGNPSYDPERGIGKYTTVDLGVVLNQEMATKGKAVADVKCLSCHKTTDEKLVGPGWRGVTSRHKPEWIMNFITNVNEMLDKDPKAQAQLEICLVRMPNQNLSDDEARQLLEFMRKNDGVK